jgi:hypothetical protein
MHTSNESTSTETESQIPPQPSLNIRDLFGLIPTISAAPIHIPRKFDEQFRIYKSGSTTRFYWYDPVNATWQYAEPISSTDYSKRVVGVLVVDPSTDVATGDGKAFFRVPSVMNGWNLISVAMNVYTAGVTGTMDVQIRNVTDSTDMLSTKLTIDSSETDTSTAATAAVIDTTKDDVATGDKIAIDVDAVQTTKAKGLYVELTFQAP